MSLFLYRWIKEPRKYYVSYGDGTESSDDDFSTIRDCKEWIEENLSEGVPFWIVEHRTIREGVR